MSKPTTDVHACLSCGSETTDLKYYMFLDQFLCLPVIAIHELKPIYGCPSCVRAQIWKKATALLPTAHILWPVIVLPLAIYLSLCSLLPGHSSQFDMPDRNPRYLEPPAWKIWMAVLCVEFFGWLPVLGLVYCSVAYFLTRHDDAHLRFNCQAGLILSISVTALVAGAIIYFGCVHGWDEVKW